MRYPPRFPRQRPAWWPENENWPPAPRRPRFFRMMGCMFSMLLMSFFLFMFFVIAVVGRERGWPFFATHRVPGMTLLVGVLAGLFFLGLIAGAGYVMRSMSSPLDALLEAARRVARGEPTRPVCETGSPETRQLAQAFNLMLKRLQDDEARRRNLMADVSHELRTPLTILRGTIEGMQDGLYPADETRWNSLLEEINLLDRLVEDLRTLSQAESGALTLRREPVELTGLLGEAAAAFRSSQVDIQTAFSGEGLVVEADPARLREVVDNLLSNAVRHTPPGGAIWLRCQGIDAKTVELEVEDSGPGIAAQDLPHIFERFYKSGDSRGMGLGLSIAKTLVEAHGGTIQAFSPPGKGALMRLRLPRKI